MNNYQIEVLGKMLRQGRLKAGLTSRAVAERCGIDHTNVLRLEQGAVPNPRLKTLHAVAGAIDLDLNDLLASVGYVQPGKLPSFTPYMRSKYSDLPTAAIDELDAAFHHIAAKHGYDPAGPKPGEDES